MSRIREKNKLHLQIAAIAKLRFLKGDNKKLRNQEKQLTQRWRKLGGQGEPYNHNNLLDIDTSQVDFSESKSKGSFYGIKLILVLGLALFVVNQLKGLDTPDSDPMEVIKQLIDNK